MKSLKELIARAEDWKMRKVFFGKDMQSVLQRFNTKSSKNLLVECGLVKRATCTAPRVPSRYRNKRVLQYRLAHKKVSMKKDNRLYQECQTFDYKRQICDVFLENPDFGGANSAFLDQPFSCVYYFIYIDCSTMCRIKKKCCLYTQMPIHIHVT